MAFETAGHVVFPHAEAKIWNRTYDFLGSTKKIMLMSTAPDGTEEFLDDGTSDDIASKELNTANYVGGFGGSGRKTVTGALTVEAEVSNAAALLTNFLHATTYTWAALGTAGDGVAGALMIVEATADTDSHPVIWLPFYETYSLTGDNETWTPPTPLLSIKHSIAGDE